MAQNFLLSIRLRNLSFTGLSVNSPYDSKSRVHVGEFNTGIFRAELPTGPGVMEIAVFFPRADFADEDLLAGDATVESLRRENV